MLRNICICGGGSTGHVIAGYLSGKGKACVNILTTKPDRWSKLLKINTPDDGVIIGKPNVITDEPPLIIPQCDVVLLCLPGFAIKEELLKIQPYVKPGTFVGSVFSSTGFFFEALKIFDKDVKLFGFQRVPFISRVKEYGREANLMGYKSSLNIAIENADDKESFRKEIEQMLDVPVVLLKNYYEASFTNSNPLLHPARLYSMFRDWHEGMFYDHNVKFYEEWDDFSSDLLIKMDAEFFKLNAKLPVRKDYLPTLLDYYESHDAQSLTRKISSIAGFKGIMAPMRQVEGGWVPDFKSRYFIEDFPFGLRYIYEKAQEMGVETPVIKEVFDWGMDVYRKYSL